MNKPFKRGLRVAVYRNNKLVDLVRIDSKKATSFRDSTSKRGFVQSPYFNGTSPNLDCGCDFQPITGNPSFPSWGELIRSLKTAKVASSTGNRHDENTRRKVLEAKAAGRKNRLIAEDYGVSIRTIQQWAAEA